MRDDRGPLLGTAVVLAAAACFGTLGTVSRLAYDGGLSPLSFVAWRAVIGTLVLGAVIAARAASGSGRAVPPGVPRRERLTLLFATGAGIVLNLALFAAFERVTVALALFGFYTYPVMVAVVGVVLMGDGLDARRLGALALAMGGMVLVVAGQADRGGAPIDPVGLALALVAGASQAFFVLVTRRGYRSIPSEHASAVILGTGAIAFVVLALATGSTEALLLPLRAPDLLALVAFAGIVAAGLATFLFVTGIRLVGPLRTGILSLFEPVVGVALAAVVLGEAVTPAQAVGGGLVLAAAAVLQRRPARVAAGPAPEAGAG